MNGRSPPCSSIRVVAPLLPARTFIIAMQGRKKKMEHFSSVIKFETASNNRDRLLTVACALFEQTYG